MRIGELARQTGVRPATLRYYEGRGLLSRPARTNAGYRSYTSECVAQLRLIRWAKGLGFTLREIREMTGAIGEHAGGRGDRVRLQVRAKIAEVDAKMSRAIAPSSGECSRGHPNPYNGDDTVCAPVMAAEMCVGCGRADRGGRVDYVLEKIRTPVTAWR